MSKYPNDETIDKMEEVLNVASDYTRLKIMYALIDGEKSVSEIVEIVGASQSLASHQLSVLKKAFLVATRKEATRIYYRLSDHHVIELLNVIHEHVLEGKEE